jgi:hypothetical protein
MIIYRKMQQPVIARRHSRFHKKPWYIKPLTMIAAVIIMLSGVIVFTPETASAAITRVQLNTGITSGGTSVAATYTTTPVAGNLLVAIHAARGEQGVLSGWSTARASTSNDGGGVTIYYKTAVGTENTVTATTVGSRHQTLAIFEYSGMSVVTVSDVSQVNNSGNTQVLTLATGTTSTTTESNSLLIGAFNTEGSASFANTWTNSFVQSSNLNTVATNPNNRTDSTSAERIVTATGTFTTTESWGTSRRAAGVIVAFRAARATQYGYRWYGNADSVQPGTAIANENTAAQGCSLTGMRLRMNVWMGEDSWGATTKQLKLQYGTSTSGPWTDVGSDATWAFRDNPIPADGSTITSNLLSKSTVLETYEENNPTATNPNALNVGAYGEWDFSLDPTNVSSGTYFFRLAESAGTALTFYFRYPTIILQQPPATESVLRHGAWFDSNGVEQTYDSCYWVKA